MTEFTELFEYNSETRTDIEYLVGNFLNGSTQHNRKLDKMH